MAAALALSERGMGRTGLNPAVGCIIVKGGQIIGRGWTQPSGRPHAEAKALAQADEGAAGATIYVTLEPCAHQSERGPACAEILVASGAARIVIACQDPDSRTLGKGAALLESAGLVVQIGVLATEARRTLTGYLSRVERGRPFVTLKLATSLDGAIALSSGESQWITGEAARAHTHLERSRSDMILVGAGTVRDDNPALDVRLPGLESFSPQRVMLGSGDAPAGWAAIRKPEDIWALKCNNLLVEGGAKTGASFIRAGLVDRLLLYRAPILIGGGLPCLGDIGLGQLGDAHDQWLLQDSRMLGKDRMEIYTKSPS
jgi:diaminohydroxyphosphoribosylaminopyrimidine deaminase / 5-amino-6-(5-phosphoribosylamino)uracil reductase